MGKRKKKAYLKSQSLQVRVRAKVPKGFLITPKVLQEALDSYINNEVAPQGFEISMIIWHKEYVDGREKDYEYSDESDFPAILSAAKKAGIVPRFFSPVLAS